MFEWLTNLFSWFDDTVKQGITVNIVSSILFLGLGVSFTVFFSYLKNKASFERRVFKFNFKSSALLVYSVITNTSGKYKYSAV